jgi:hypothetical protein
VEELRQLLLFPPSEEFPLTLDNAHVLLLKAVMVGNVLITKHFKVRQEERGFDTIDVERAIRDGNFLGSPEYCKEFTNWVFRISGKSETRNFEARVALDWQEDLELPTVIYITGICKGDAKWRRREKRTQRSRQ